MPVTVHWFDGRVEPIAANRAALERAAERLTRAAERDLRRAPQPPLYQSGVRWQAERGREDWLVPSQVARQGHADCEDVSAWRAAELRLRGERDARVAVRRVGPNAWHAVVRRADGRIEDPSRRLGMGEHTVGAIAPAGTQYVLTWKVARVSPQEWRGEVVMHTTTGDRIRARGRGRNRGEALARAVNTATSALDNPAMRAILPPQATAALAVLRSKPVARAARSALRLARGLGLRL